MNESEFLKKWQQEKPMYEAWGDFVLSKIIKELEKKSIDKNSFLKNTPKVRLKSDNSIINKAFYRTDKQYKNPYVEIEDKVGLRFVVLLIEQIQIITEIIESVDSWVFEKSRHFETEREESPLLFTYQSVHYIIKSKENIDYSNSSTLIKSNIPCEVQIRTILQHAYAELTHDSVYKARTLVEPEVQRTIAKSMALIETTDDFFSDVKSKLSTNSYDVVDFQKELDNLYIKYIDPDYNKEAQKSDIVIIDVFKDIIDEDTIGRIERLIANNSIEQILQPKTDQIYRQSIVLFVIYLIKKKRTRLIKDWPLNKEIIKILATDLGVSLEQ